MDYYFTITIIVIHCFLHVVTFKSITTTCLTPKYNNNINQQLIIIINIHNYHIYKGTI